MFDAQRVLARAGVLVAVGLLALVGGTRTSSAQGTVEMGLDMETTGNAADSLGVLQSCYEVSWSGTPFDGIADWTIDVYVRGDTQAPLSYDAWVTYDDGKVHVVDPTDPLIKMPGASALGDSPPDSDGQLNAGASYLNPPYDGIPGDGTLVRMSLDIGGSGVVLFGFAKGSYRSADGLHSVTTMTAQLAINSTCSASPVGGIAEYPAIAQGSDDRSRASTDSFRSALDYALLLGLAAAAALAGAALYARRRWVK